MLSAITYNLKLISFSLYTIKNEPYGNGGPLMNCGNGNAKKKIMEIGNFANNKAGSR